jgi:hypothetical protein
VEIFARLSPYHNEVIPDTTKRCIRLADDLPLIHEGWSSIMHNDASIDNGRVNHAPVGSENEMALNVHSAIPYQRG